MATFDFGDEHFGPRLIVLEGRVLSKEQVQRVRTFRRNKISCMRQADGQQVDIGRRAVPLAIGYLDRQLGEDEEAV